MKYQVVLFDFDYTLANSEKGILLSFEHVLENHGFHNMDQEKIKKTIGLTLEDSFSVLTGETDREKLLAWKSEYIEKANSVMTPNTFLYPGAIPLLEKIKDRGAKTGIISSKYRFRIMETIERYEIPHLLDHIIGVGDVKKAKPDPEGLLVAVKHFGVKPSQILYVGDNIVDALAAKAAGIDFVGVLTGTTTRAEFERLPHVQIVEGLWEIEV